MKNKPQISYTIVNHIARKELKLTMNEYAFLDTVYNLSNNPTSPYPDWCYASKETLGKILGLSRQSIYDLINRLVIRKCLRKDETTKYLQVAIADWETKTNIGNRYVKIPYTGSQGSLQSSKENLQNNSKATLPNKDNSNKRNKKDVYIQGEQTIFDETSLLHVLEVPNEQLKKLPDYVRVYRCFLRCFETTPEKVRFTSGRKEKILARLKNYPTEDIFKAVRNASLSDFYQGKNKDGWKVTLDWLMSEDERIEKLRDLPAKALNKKVLVRFRDGSTAWVTSQDENGE